MSDYKQVIGEDTFYTLNHLWMLVSKYPKFEEMERLFDLKQSKIDTSRYTYTNSGTQFPLDPDDWAQQQSDFFEWMQSKFDDLRLPFEIECVLASWAIEYNKHGFQTAHRHSYEALNPHGGEISCVINFDNVPAIEGNEVNGNLFTFIPAPNGYQYYEEHPSVRGQCIMMHGEVWHGVYPTLHQRRCIVIDVKYKHREISNDPNN